MIQPSSLFKTSKIAAALLLCSSVAYADEAVQQTEETTAQTTKNSNVFTLGTVVVSASMPQTSELFESYISKETIDLLEAKDVGEALQYTPGVFYDSPIASGNSGRFESGVTVRGYGLRYVPIYVDGIPVYIPYDGYSDMGRFSTADISSIQVAKGYSSVMYGHNTMGGAVNIVTMKPRSKFDFSGVIGGGSGNTQETSVNVGTLQENWYLQAGFSDRTRKYTRLAEKYEGIDAEGQMVNSDKYLYNVKDRRANVKVGWTPNATDEYVLSYSKQEAKKYPGHKGQKGFIPTTWKWPKWDRETISFVSTTWLMDDKVYIKPRIYYDTYKNTLTGWRGDPKGSHYDDKAFGASVEVGTTVISNHLVKMMLSYKDETHKSFDTFPNSSLHMPDSDSKATQKFYSIALEDTITFNEQWEAQLGIVYTKRTASASDIGINTQHLLNTYPAANSMLAPSYNSTDFQAALFYKPTDLDTFRFTIGKKTRFPSFKESYSNYAGGSEKKCPKGQTGCKAGEFVPSITLQNPGLKPESALNIELGYNGTPIDGLTMDAALFYSQSKDAIDRSDFDFNSFPGYAIRQSINLPGKVERKGIELGLDYELSPYLQLGAGYTYMTVKNKDHKEIKIKDMPKHFGYLYASIKPVDWIAITPSMTGRSSSYANMEGTAKNKAYQIYDLKVSVMPPQWKGVTFNAGVDNIFNKNYASFNNDYSSPGRSFYANMRIDFY